MKKNGGARIKRKATTPKGRDSGCKQRPEVAIQIR